MVIFLAFSNIYSGGLFLLTNKKLESAGTCGFVDIFHDCSALSWDNLLLIHHGEHLFSQSACGGHYVFTHEDIVFMRRTIHFRSCAQDLDKIYYHSHSFDF